MAPWTGDCSGARIALLFPIILFTLRMLLELCLPVLAHRLAHLVKRVTLEAMLV